MFRLGLLALLVLWTTIWSTGRASAHDITMWVYHNFPPFVVDEDSRTGMSFDLAQMLTDRSEGRYRFHVVVLPRQRLNMKLANDAPGLVLWANPLWFGDPERTTYLWTDPLLNDRNDVISPNTAPFSYDGPASLDGNTMVGVKGHRYPGVDELVTDGRIDRIDVSSEAALVQFVASGRGRVGIVAHSAAVYFVDAYGLEDRVHFAAAPHSTYQRYIMVQPHLKEVNAFISATMPDIAQSKDWRALINKHRFEPVPIQ